ncbi:hypothetical protein BC939DRAFT_532138 [Gamsiella multidivaricata]|uniref:uncharacterized protein n=1 Tax=Gamsiella multidivaricata TaxID=101098 RepID=UPI0022210CD4|nr:uncharacterized protein BC939DRAFT_532138 [Gamsiella multidivaricata]KAG0370547.1 hypothetical protein BGZ54_005777 [Gamsiella multidivaricata]KAI7818312.1 hypothetical protein BC939DRAFT_532138 [Gamsiella multidivaricata]
MSISPDDAADSSTANESAGGPELITPQNTKIHAKPIPHMVTEQLSPLPRSTALPDLADFNLRPMQYRNPVFSAICKVLILYGNAWQSASDLVDGIRHFNLANLGGMTPRGTIQGAISTGLALSAALGLFDPIEKQRVNNTTYYRMDIRVLVPPDSAGVASNGADQVGQALTSTEKGKEKAAEYSTTKKRKASTLHSSDSDSLEEDGSQEPSDGQSGSPSSSKHERTNLPVPETSSKQGMHDNSKDMPENSAPDVKTSRSNPVDSSAVSTEVEESTKSLENIKDSEDDYPDERAKFGVNLTQEPSMFAVKQKTGYTHSRFRNSERLRVPKPDCEDGFAVADLQYEGGFLGRIFCITDGHGGRACSSYVIATFPRIMQVILGKYSPEDLSVPSAQESIKSQLTEAIHLIDREYLDYKKRQYLDYKVKKIQHDPGNDGATLVANVIIDKWIISVNVGDSRTLLSTRDSNGRWNLDFYTEDHIPSLERFAPNIHANGGEFVARNDTVIRFDTKIKNDKKQREDLKGAKVRIREGALASSLYGIPYRNHAGRCVSINLAASIGDLLYKLDPDSPVLTNRPDIKFIDTTAIEHGYLFMASRGLWDNVLQDKAVEDQNVAVCEYVGDKLDRGWGHQRIVGRLSDREGKTELYTDPVDRYGDFTAILVSLNKQHGQQDRPGSSTTEQEQDISEPLEKLQIQGEQQSERSLEQDSLPTVQ